MTHPNDTNKNTDFSLSTKTRTNKVIHPELSYKITGIIFRTQNEIGRFRNEEQYCDKIEALLKEIGILYERELILSPSFEGEKTGRNRVDFLIDGKIILEIKTKSFITKNDYHQAQRYLTALNKEFAILVNMRRYYIRPKRILNSAKRDSDHSDINS